MKMIVVVVSLVAVGFAGGLLAGESGLVDVEAITGARMAVAQAETFSPMFEHDAGRTAALEALKGADPSEGIAKAKEWLAKLPVDGQMLLALADAERRAGKLADSFAHRSAYYGLLASLMASGEGTQEKPFKVIAVAEEYVFFREIGARMGRQALTQINGKPHDRVSVTVGSEERTYFFDVSLSFEAMNRSLGR
ncbi:MAG: DUF4919 domain-containing protein [Planctomycetes bacterium]|jgi:hypothetical protein|nr:DUF4919 domain-containing protein [Planctomycetota bacterium]